MNRLREILGDSADSPRFVETVPKRGYRFVAPVTAIETASRTAADQPQRLQEESGAKARWFIPVGIAGLIALAGASFLLTRNARTGEALAPAPITSLPGREASASLSPDGRQVAFVWDGPAGENLDIYRMEIGQQSPHRLTESPAREYSPRWSPDGRSIAFIREIDMRTAAVLVMPAIGGSPRQVGSITSPPQGYTSHSIPRRSLDWTPDSNWVITADAEGPDGPFGLVALSVRNGARRQVLAAPSAGRGLASPIISPDGREIAFLQGGVAHTAAALLRASMDSALRISGPVQRLPLEFPWVDSVTWGPGKRSMLVSVAATLDGQRNLQLYQGEHQAPEALPGIGGDAVEPDFCPSAARLVFTRLDSRRSSIWSLFPNEPARLPVQLSASTSSNMDADISPDGDWIAFRSLRSGKPAIWLSRTDGTGLRQLADIGADGYGNPRWSPDGQRIAFHARLKGTSQIYVAGIDGRNPMRVEGVSTNSIFPTWSRDGNSVYFRTDKDGPPRIWKIKFSARSPELALAFDALYAVEDESGTGLYVAEAGRPPILAHINLQTKVRRTIFPGIASPAAIATSRQGVYFLTAPDAAGRSEVRFQKSGASTSKVIRRIDKPVDSGLGVSCDGRVVVYSQVDQAESTLMLVEGMR